MIKKEELKQQLAKVNVQIGLLNKTLSSFSLPANVPTDFNAVLMVFLKEKLGFDYEAEKSNRLKDFEAAKKQLAALSSEKYTLETDIYVAEYFDRAVKAGVSFKGPAVQSFDHEGLTLKCCSCQTTFKVKPNAASGFEGYLDPRTMCTELDFMCPRCQNKAKVTVVKKH